MLENQKKWCKERIRNGKEWVGDHKYLVGCIAGCAATSIGYVAGWKIFESKTGRIEYTYNEKDNSVIADVITTDRFNRKTKMLSLRWDDPDVLKQTVDWLGTIVYPGD